MKEIVITKDKSNQRADKFVRRFLNDAPLSFIYKIFRKKDVKVNNHRIKENYILQENDVLKIFVTDTQLSEFNNPKKIEDIKLNFGIVYEDENILIANKPKGLLIHGDESEKRTTLSNMVLSYLYKKGEYKNNLEGFIPSPCHRLDRNTSGLVIFGKNVISSQIIMNLFKEHTNIIKTYYALLDGKVEESGKIEAPLLKDEKTGFVKVQSISKGAKRATTSYKLVQFEKNMSLVEATLITGRTHQLRVHFSYINHPIIGDQKYGNFDVNKKFDSKFNYHYQFLHAYKLEFKNVPFELSYLNGKTFVAPLFNKDKEILMKLGFKTDEIL